MALTPGTRLGAYEVLALLGNGGMGEVYRARDTRLDRIVAIKILHPDAAGDPDRRQRLDREARAIASLNHPHICTLYDVGHQDGIDYLVMELLEGQTLAERLTRGRAATRSGDAVRDSARRRARVCASTRDRPSRSEARERLHRASRVWRCDDREAARFRDRQSDASRPDGGDRGRNLDGSRHAARHAASTWRPSSSKDAAPTRAVICSPSARCSTRC